MLEEFQKLSFVGSNGKELKYRLFVPTELKPNPKMIVWMHGMGERGEDNEKHVSWVYADYVEHLRSLYNDNVIILAPQCPSNDFWYKKIDGRFYNADDFIRTESIIAAEELIKDIINKFKVVETAATGFSMGGGAVIIMALDMPCTFKRIVAMGPGMVPNKGNIDVFKTTKLILTCAYNDSVVSFSSTRKFGDYLLSLNIPFTFFQYGDGDHLEAFTYTVDNIEVISTLLMD